MLEPPTIQVAPQKGVSYLGGIRERIQKGENVDTTELLRGMQEFYTQKPITLVPLLSMLTLGGKPYNLVNHFPMEPMFKVKVPKRTIWKCARQISKSTSLAANGVLRSAAALSTEPLKTLFVTPRFEQIRRLSNNYVRPFILGSLIRPFMVDEENTQAVLQRSFSNGSMMFFSFAFLDCDRIRGISADCLVADEMEDLDYDFLPIISSCMDASNLGISIYSGTPKTLDNGMEVVWSESSKAEWVIPCESCGHWNTPTLAADLLKMIERKGIVCGKCKKPVNPRTGSWYHTDIKNFPGTHGFHIPQIIMPMHYENPEKWAELIAKSEGQMGYNQQKFMNEILGESADMGAKLISITDIRNTSKLGPNEYSSAIEEVRKCRVRVMGVDWGGGGQEEISFTIVALCGFDDFTQKVKCFYAYRFPLASPHDEEAKRLLTIFRDAGCHWFCHDYCGAGAVRETLMLQAGLPMNRIMNFLYTGRAAVTRDLVVYNKPHPGEVRGWWSVDKSRSLVLQATALKAGSILLPEYESTKSITNDFLALYEDKHEFPGGSDTYFIRRNPKMTDDFAHALNYACLGIWHSEQNYPDLSAAKAIKLTEEQLNFASPPNVFRGDVDEDLPWHRT